MGNLQTVVPSGPYDTTRNPALLALQSSTNSTGLFYSYITHFLGDSSINYDQYLRDTGIPFDAGISTDTKQKDPEINGMSCHIANSTKSGNYAIGFAITDNGNDQYLVTKKESKRESVGNSAGIEILERSNEYTKTTEYNPAFVTSLGTNISSTSFIGCQLIVGYSDVKEEKESFVERYIVSVLQADFEEKRNKETKEISSELGFGYLYKNNDQQVGLLFRTGEFSWTEKKLTVRNDNLMPPASTVKANSSVKMNGKYTAGPGIVTGVYNRINSKFALAFESGIKFENSYIDKELEYMDTNTIEERENTIEIKNIYSIKAGFEMNPSDNLTFMLGIGYLTGSFKSNQYSEKDTYSKEFNVEMDIKYGISTFGIQYISSKNITIDFITALMPYRKIIKLAMKEEDTTSTYKSELYAKQIDEGIYLHTGLGITLSF